MSHFDPEDRTADELGVMLSEVYMQYPEYEDFDEMVRKFATDDFYHYHFVALRYLKLTGKLGW